MARPGFWIDTLLATTTTIGTPKIDSLMTNVSSSQSRRGWTCVRTIIGLDVAVTVHDAGEGSQRYFIGIGVASQEAFAAGAIADPETVTDHPTRGWLYRAGYRIFNFAADQPAVFVRRIEKDIRAKRKLDNGEMYVAQSAVAQEGATTTITTIGFIRQYWLDE